MNKKISIGSLLLLIMVLPACNWFGGCCNKAADEVVEIKEETPVAQEATTPEASVVVEEETASTDKI